jgi:GNAT superfamily N-acetyltransferase
MQPLSESPLTQASSEEEGPELKPDTPSTDTEIEIVPLKKGKKNGKRYFGKLMKVDKEAFGDID